MDALAHLNLKKFNELTHKYFHIQQSNTHHAQSNMGLDTRKPVLKVLDQAQRLLKKFMLNSAEHEISIAHKH